MIPNPWLIVGALVAGIALFLGGYDKGHHDARLSDQAQIAADKLKANKAARAKEQEWQQKLAAVDAQHQKELQDAKDVEDKLRADVASGARRLRILVTRASIAADTKGAGSSDDASVELAPVARQTYYDLRAAIVKDHATINACQGYIRSIGGAE